MISVTVLSIVHLYPQQYFIYRENDKTINNFWIIAKNANNILMECSDIEDNEFYDCESEPEDEIEFGT